MSKHLSAIAFVHKMYGHRDNTAVFFIQKFMQGARNSRSVCDVRQPIRQPITLDILICLVDLLEALAYDGINYYFAVCSCWRFSDFRVSEK